MPHRARTAAAEAGHQETVSSTTLAEAATITGTELLRRLQTPESGLPPSEVISRRSAYGPNVVHTFRVRWWQVLLRQLQSPLLALLAVTCITAFFVGEAMNATIILVILTLSIGLSFMNEYRAEQTAVDLHRRIQDFCTVIRVGLEVQIPVTEIVLGDIITVELGEIIPADIRFIDTVGLEVNESVLTGESTPVAKTIQSIPLPQSLTDHTNCGFMGTVVSAGTGTGVVVAIGSNTHFGSLALELGLTQGLTGFQIGLKRFSRLLLMMAGILMSFVFLANLALHRPVIDAVLFSLAIAVGITPQMLPAVVTISLSRGARMLAKHRVIVKRLISIEDLGDVQILFTDKTGTLTQGELSFEYALNTEGVPDQHTLHLGLLATASMHSTQHILAGHEPLDRALWAAATPSQVAALNSDRLLEFLPFDHERQRSSVVVQQAVADAHTFALIVKGAPESIFAQCETVPAGIAARTNREFSRGSRVVALASRTWSMEEELSSLSESGLTLQGLLVYRDVPKPNVAEAIERLHSLSIDVKVITGDNALVAQAICAEIGLGRSQTRDPSTSPAPTAVTGNDLDAMSDEQLAATLPHTTIFARVSPAQKLRIVRVQRALGADVAFLGDGVNDALALHEADVGISVDSATDVAKDAADVVLLDKDLHILADGVMEGRRVFANTIKYVSMGSSSNFGNMFSAAGASLFLPFLPMLPSQILLNNLLYDASQLAISGDRVDAEQLRRPSHWDIGMIRRYMLFFGLISSFFDFSTFALMLTVFHASAPTFRSAWFLESLATQTLVILVIRTARRPFWRSRASSALMASVCGAVACGAGLLWSPMARELGFRHLAWEVCACIAGLVVAYLTLVEVGKHFFIRAPLQAPTQPVKVARPHRRRRRRARKFTLRM